MQFKLGQSLSRNFTNIRKSRNPVNSADTKSSASLVNSADTKSSASLDKEKTKCVLSQWVKLCRDVLDPEWIAANPIREEFCVSPNFCVKEIHKVIRQWREIATIRVRWMEHEIELLNPIGYRDFFKSLNTPRKVMTAYCVELLREMFGDTPQPVPNFTPNPLLLKMTEDHKILADAAEDHGFSYQPALDHLRQDKKHCKKFCWAVLAVLGKHPQQIS